MMHHHHTEHSIIIWHDHDGRTISGGSVRPTEGAHDHELDNDPPCDCGRPLPGTGSPDKETPVTTTSVTYPNIACHICGPLDGVHKLDCPVTLPNKETP